MHYMKFYYFAINAAISTLFFFIFKNTDKSKSLML